MKIALDGMGGDFAPANPVAGAIEALRRFPQIEKLYVVGREGALKAELARHGPVPPRLEIVPATQVVEMKDAAIDAVRRKKDSSISRAVDLVKSGDADAVVSAGHTGAAVAAATVKLRTLPGVVRPGIATVLPTETNLFVLIDAGANIDAKPVHLGQYAIMGAAYSQHVLGYANPAVGLMSIGTEEAKGNELTKVAFKLLSSLPINFRGNIEGHDLFENPVEVAVCDGFVGNVVLKTSESIASAMLHWLKRELMRTPLRMLGAFLAKGAFQVIRRKTNYEEIGGSPLLGVNGICIIAHGSSTALAITNAIRVAAESIQHDLNPHIIERIAAAHDLFGAAEEPTPTNPLVA
jgi:phosphate acyltransferase